MKIPEKSRLPVELPEYSFVIDEKRVQLFKRAFRDDQNPSTPPTLGIIGMSEMFHYLERIEVDWRKLLHATQQFEYHRPLSPIPIEVVAKTKLVDCKLRAKIHWLSFETELLKMQTSENLLTAKSLILVRE